MDHKAGRIVSLVFYSTLLYLYFVIEYGSASILDTSSRRRRSIQEQGDINGQFDVCADVLGPKWNMTKEGKGLCPTLVVWVSKKSGFTEFVKVNEHSEVEDGLSLAIFCYALQLIPFPVQPIFRPYVNDKGEMKGTYDQLLKQIEGETCQAIAGDITIRGNRAEYVAFTIPYLSAGIYMLVQASHEWNQTLWTFLKPFTPTLWAALVYACIVTGVAVAFLEYRIGNPDFNNSLWMQLIMVFWFPVSTFLFHEGQILSKCARVVLVTWLYMVFIVLQIFTATLSSWLTLDQMLPRLPSNLENIGYQNGSFVKDFIMQEYNCSGLLDGLVIQVILMVYKYRDYSYTYF